MTDQSTTAIQPYQKLKKLISSDEIQKRFSLILKERAPAFLASILNTAYLDDNLKDADPNSIITAALTAAALDLPVDRNLGQSWIIGYKDDGRKIARFQMGYRGYVQLAIRSGQYQELNAGPIYDGETVQQDRLTGRITIKGTQKSDKVIGYAAYFKLLNGFEKFHYMTREQVTDHAKRYAKSYGNAKSTWTTDFDKMAVKVVLTALLKKWGLLSVTMQTAAAIDMADPEDDGTHNEALNDLLASRQNAIDADFVEAPAENQELESGAPMPEEPPEEMPGLTVTTRFEPAELLVEKGIAQNVYQANNLIKNYVPDDVLKDQTKLVAWGKIYRGWRDSGASGEIAKQHADRGELPK